MNIIKEIRETVKDIKFFAGYEEVDVNSLPGMPRDENAVYIPPLCIPGCKNSPRMRYRR